ncbi:hypothetical protein WJ969_14405 [Achromobacter xylosoxidans]
MNRILSAAALAAALATSLTAPSHALAALPMAVDGQPCPRWRPCSNA